MGDRAAKVKQTDLTRYIAAALKAGLQVEKIEVKPDGTVAITPVGMADDGTGGDAARTDMTPLEKWRATRAAS